MMTQQFDARHEAMLEQWVAYVATKRPSVGQSQTEVFASRAWQDQISDATTRRYGVRQWLNDCQPYVTLVQVGGRVGGKTFEVCTLGAGDDAPQQAQQAALRSVMLATGWRPAMVQALRVYPLADAETPQEPEAPGLDRILRSIVQTMADRDILPRALATSGDDLARELRLLQAAVLLAAAAIREDSNANG